MIEPTERTKAFSFFFSLSYLGNYFISLSNLYPFFYLFSVLDNPYNKENSLFTVYFFPILFLHFFLSRIIYYSQ